MYLPRQWLAALRIVNALQADRPSRTNYSTWRTFLVSCASIVGDWEP